MLPVTSTSVAASLLLPTTAGMVRSIFGACVVLTLMFVGTLEQRYGSNSASAIESIFDVAPPQRRQLFQNVTTSSAAAATTRHPLMSGSTRPQQEEQPTRTGTMATPQTPFVERLQETSRANVTSSSHSFEAANVSSYTFRKINPDALIISELQDGTSGNTLGACLLIMDDTIKLTEWLAYHYTVAPLSHLIVAIDPESSNTPHILKVLELYKTRMYIEVWINDESWMVLPPDKGWSHSKDYELFLEDNTTDIVKHKVHVRRQNHFVYRCNERFREMKSQEQLSDQSTQVPSFVLHIDSDEFLTYNYYDNSTEHPESIDENNRFMDKGKRKRREQKIRQGRKAAIPIRSSLPAMDSLNYTFADFIVDHFSGEACTMIVGLKFSTQESNWTSVRRQVPDGIDAQKLQTLRYRFHESKNGRFNKVMFNIDQLTKANDWKYANKKTIHNPMPSRCFRNGPTFAGFDYQWSILRLHHYVGSYEAFAERHHDSRGARKTATDRRAAYKRRRVPDAELEGPNDELRSWITLFVHHRLGGNVTEARRLLSPLDDAYDEQSFEGILKQ